MESAGGGCSRAIATAADREREVPTPSCNLGAGGEVLVQHSPFAFSPRSWLAGVIGWLRGWRLIGALLVLMGLVGLVSTVAGWYPAP